MKTFWQVWLAPIVMGVLTTFGLLAALLGVGIWHWLSWMALSIPLAAIMRYTMMKDKVTVKK